MSDTTTYRTMIGEVEIDDSWTDEHGHHYEPLEHVYGDVFPRDGRYTFVDDLDAVSTDHFVEHITKAVVVTGRNEGFVLNSRSGVLWFGRFRGEDTRHEASEEALQLAHSLVETTTPVGYSGDDGREFDRPDGYEKAVGGWHSSMESSEQSELMNALAAGDIPPEWCDDGDPFPYAVRYGDTRNVCSVNGSIYANPYARDLIADVFDGKRARPGGAGFA